MTIAFQSPAKSQSVAEILVQASDILNQQLPMRIDQDTQWDSTFVGPGQVMNYNYTLLNYSVAELDSNQFTREFRPFVTQALCEEPSSQIFRDNNVAFGVNVYDNNHSLVSRIDVSPKECK
ncbi:MAG: hypothetical protein HC930_14385 [Hydrococcus sp. SU_1_0]|nr:hypothetical protein [Hydrococcus sp. SU_1_0]